LCRRSIKARLFGPGISVLILVDSSIVATSSCRANSFQYTRRRLPSDTPERDVFGVVPEEVGGAAYPLMAEAGLSLSPHFEYHYPASDSLLISDSLITSEGSL
jgi:hypothetical protein